MKDPIRIIIADDHDIVRRGLKASISTFEDLNVIAQAHTGEEAVQLCTQHQPDVLLLDLVLPGMQGIEVIEAVQKCSSSTKVVALTNFKKPELVHGVLEAGATSYLLKNVSVDELASTIRKAYAGESILAPEAAKVLITRIKQPTAQDFELTNREIDVLALLVEGLSNPEIADRLFISRSTVKNHVSSIMAKLEATSRTEAATKAVKLNLIKPQ